MTTSADLEAKRQKIETIVKVLALAVAGFLFAPFAILTIKGLISLVVVAVIGLGVVNIGIPWLGVTLANWRLKALKAAAAANPIETLENQYADREAALVKIRDNIKQSYAVLQDLYQQIQDHNQRYPGSPSQYTEKYNKLKQLIELRGKKYKQAQANLAQFAELIDEKRSDWKIAQTMAAANKLANVGQDFQAKLLQDTALSTVQDGLNLAFSELETSLLDENDTTATQSTATVTVSDTPVRAQLSAPVSSPSTLDLGFDSDNVQDVEATPVPARRSSGGRRS